MKRVSLIVMTLVALTLADVTQANTSDVKEGEELYLSQCKTCHGALSGEETGFREPFNPPWRIHLAMIDSVTPDVAHLVSSIITASSTTETRSVSRPRRDQLAVALPYGPTLRGVVGRPAASVEGYAYSQPFLNTLKDTVWSEENLNRWISDTQAWVPGSFMYYKQPDSEIRRKIILYLKANPA